MAFRIPGETASEARFRQRAERSRQAQEEQEKRQQDIVSRRIAQIEFEEDFRRWKERMAFDLYLTAGEILTRLECQRDDHRPKTMDEEWDDEFCEAIRLIPEARMFMEETSIHCIRSEGK